jgi:hydroxyacylglutathione hydrolase
MTLEVISFVHEGLGNSSYLVEVGGGRAIAIDPDRTVGRYLEAARSRGLDISHVLETHVHADFVSGARDIAAATGARLFMPQASDSRVDHVALSPGTKSQLDGVQVQAIGSPGHTPEHLSYALVHGEQPPLLFSGGALIVGGAARTDLISPEMTETLTRSQHRTATSAFNHLSDETLLYPTHGGGSFCSAGRGDQRTSTLGQERSNNPVLQETDEDSFVSWFPATFPAVPDYYWRMRAFNQGAPRLRREIQMPRPLAAKEFASASRGGLIVDVRHPAEFTRAHTRGALSIFAGQSYAIWLGWLAKPGVPLYFVTGEDAPLGRVIDESLLVGYEHFGGYLDGGFETWAREDLPTAGAEFIESAEARDALADGAVALDVREDSEFKQGHIDGAINVPLGSLQSNLQHIPRDRPIITYCAHGPRATSALSILERAGDFGPLLNLRGGYEVWAKSQHVTV